VAHRSNRCLGGEKLSGKIDLKHAVEIGLRDRPTAYRSRRRSPPAQGGAEVVNEDVETAQVLVHMAHHGVDAVCGGQVGGDEKGIRGGAVRAVTRTRLPCRFSSDIPPPREMLWGICVQVSLDRVSDICAVSLGIRRSALRVVRVCHVSGVGCSAVRREMICRLTPTAGVQQ
jgi:hypothetical protein